MTMTAVLLFASVLFVAFVWMRRFGLQTCALCAAIATTWTVLLVGFFLGGPVDPLIVGILMGGSIVGITYLLKEKLHEKYHLFAFPLVMTLIAITYTLFAGWEWSTFFVLATLWKIFLSVFVARNWAAVSAVARHLTACCKNW